MQFDKVVVVGADWGAVAAWHLSLFRPDRVKGLVCLCVPFKSRHPAKPTEFFTQTFGDGFYITQFQVSFLSLSIHSCDAYAVHLYGIVLSIGTGKSREGICKIWLSGSDEEVPPDQQDRSTNSSARHGDYWLSGDAISVTNMDNWRRARGLCGQISGVWLHRWSQLLSCYGPVSTIRPPQTDSPIRFLSFSFNFQLIFYWSRPLLCF